MAGNYQIAAAFITGESVVDRNYGVASVVYLPFG